MNLILHWEPVSPSTCAKTRLFTTCTTTQRWQAGIASGFSLLAVPASSMNVWSYCIQNQAIGPSIAQGDNHTNMSSPCRLLLDSAMCCEKNIRSLCIGMTKVAACRMCLHYCAAGPEVSVVEFLASVSQHCVLWCLCGSWVVFCRTALFSLLQCIYSFLVCKVHVGTSSAQNSANCRLPQICHQFWVLGLLLSHMKGNLTDFQLCW